MDSASDAATTRQARKEREHQPFIQPTRGPTPGKMFKTQLPILLKLQPQLSPALAEAYKQRTMVERVFGRLKDEFGAGQLRVPGAPIVMKHHMFGVLALTVDQQLSLHL